MMEFHEAANLFPMMIGDDYTALRDDIKANGLLEPIVIYDGKILDGRNRYTACLDLGIEPRYEAFEGTDPVAYVISKNLHRRHLTKEQQVEVRRQMRSAGYTYQNIADATDVSVDTAWRQTQDVELSDFGKLAGDDGKYRPPSYETKDKPHVAQNSGNNEWYTPPEYIEAARVVLGGIDLDPASSPIANEIIKADKFYSSDDNGLEREWAGRIWMNPPYSQPEIEQFSKKLTASIESGNVTEAIVLVNNATETYWFQNMLAYCEAVCLIRGRVRFIDPQGNPSGAPLQGQALLYFGANREKFVEAYSKTGTILYGTRRGI